ncbi:Cytochrome P450 monooxygenase [Lachnellula occidentalis]|uniref:Cytochrome P450 monooxygenase n=1 Tax=Lachnellula occidentalis TaxID=215460 RepID=A0A8H8RHB3_9HELO|nr:Cytochrome P450 monooxygenase [Lachnellula occidentalis]
MEYGDKWRKLRKLLHQQLHESRCEKEHIILQNAEAVQMLRDFCLAPDGVMKHPKRFSNSITTTLVYGIRTATIDTPHLVELFELMEDWSKIMETGSTPPVDIFPILKYLPESLLGYWRTQARDVGKAMDALYGKMVGKVMKRRLASGSAGSFLDSVLDKQNEPNFTRDELNFMCGVVLEGGSDTSSSIIIAFIHAMIKFPNVQKKAQQDIDQHVGQNRSPVWSDYAKLPYIGMIVKETMRWRPVTPLSFPHASSQDDVVNGMSIPKNSTVILNVWGLHHDPVLVSNPDIFDPSRFATRTLLAPEYASSADYENRDHYGYGSGRRICPGIHLAERNLWLAMAKLLWAFSFTEKKGAGPIDTDVRTAYSAGFLSCAEPYECDIELRSEERRKTIMREFEQVNEEVFSQYDTG